MKYCQRLLENLILYYQRNGFAPLTYQSLRFVFILILA